MKTNDYFLKISEYCNFNVDCISHVIEDRKKFREILGIENRKEANKIRLDLRDNLTDYVLRNREKFPKDQVVKALVSSCSFKCILETLKEYDMKDMLDYILDYLKKNYDVENIVNDLIDILSNKRYEDSDKNVFTLPVFAWHEFGNGKSETSILVAMYSNDFQRALSDYFEKIKNDYLRDYADVFGEVTDNIVNKISELVNELYSRTIDRFKEIAEELYDETLEVIDENPQKYKIVGYEKCSNGNQLCQILGLDEIPVVQVEENENEEEE